MRKLAWWFCMFGMTLRRALYRPVFLLFLLTFPLGMGVLHQVEKRDSGRIAVALCPGTDVWNQALAERLESEESRSFFFYPCGTEEEAKKQEKKDAKENPVSGHNQSDFNFSGSFLPLCPACGNHTGQHFYGSLLVRSPHVFHGKRSPAWCWIGS